MPSILPLDPQAPLDLGVMGNNRALVRALTDCSEFLKRSVGRLGPGGVPGSSLGGMEQKGEPAGLDKLLAATEPQSMSGLCRDDRDRDRSMLRSNLSGFVARLWQAVIKKALQEKADNVDYGGWTLRPGRGAPAPPNQIIVTASAPRASIVYSALPRDLNSTLSNFALTWTWNTGYSCPLAAPRAALTGRGAATSALSPRTAGLSVTRSSSATT